MKQDKDILDSVKSSSPTEAGLINYLPHMAVLRHTKTRL